MGKIKNSLIKDLAVKAGFLHLSNGGYTESAAIEKLARLIVKQAAETIEKQNSNQPMDDFDRGYAAGLSAAVDAIKDLLDIK